MNKSEFNCKNALKRRMNIKYSLREQFKNAEVLRENCFHFQKKNLISLKKCQITKFWMKKENQTRQD